MLSVAENDLLTHVNADAPMGVFMRQYWLPIAPSATLIADGAPQRVTLLDRTYVAFRNTSGQVGVLDERCPHRGASLALARNEDCTLQCLYHGWRVDRTGTVLQTPSEPADSKYKNRVRAVAYPAREAGGLVWAYFGPVGAEPDFPYFDWCREGPDAVNVMRVRQRCNWLQALEGALDSAHSTFLHSDVLRGIIAGGAYTGGTSLVERMLADGAPKLEVENLPYGFQYAAIRKFLENGEPASYVRTTHYIAPVWASISTPDRWSSAQAFVPIDDDHTMFYMVNARHDGGVIDADERARIWAHTGLGQLQPDLTLHEDHHNLWGQDRARMTRGGDFTFSGLPGAQSEDLAIQESMGTVSGRTTEHLGRSDVAIIRVRRILLDEVRRFLRQDPRPSIGLGRDFRYEDIRACELMMARDESWQTRSQEHLAVVRST